MTEIPSTSQPQVLEAQKSVVEALRLVIGAEKINLLKTIHDVWPKWEDLDLWTDVGDTQGYRPSHFAPHLGKPKSAEFITSRSTPPYWVPGFGKFDNSQFWKALEESPGADKLKWFDFI